MVAPPGPRTGASNEGSGRFHNHREGPYYGLLLIEINYLLALSHVRHYYLDTIINRCLNMPSRCEIKKPDADIIIDVSQ